MLGGNGYIFAISITRIHASGESTASLSTANQSKTLRDGVQLFLTVALGADRAGRTYDSPIIPDQLVTSDWRRSVIWCYLLRLRGSRGNLENAIEHKASKWLFLCLHAKLTKIFDISTYSSFISREVTL